MARLYPPYIEGTIPAFYKNEKGTGLLTVPFSMNKAVNKSEVIGFQAMIKTVQSNNLILNLSTTSFDIEGEYKIYFTLSAAQLQKLNIGQFYKIQVAYKSTSGTIGYYSTVGVVKYTTKPTVVIEDLIIKNINMHRYSYVGHYSQLAYEYTEITNMKSNPVRASDVQYEPNKYYILSNNNYILCTDEIYNRNYVYYSRSVVLDAASDNYKDTSEKEYSYRFILFNRKNEIVGDSGTLLHNSSEDINSYESYDSFAFPSDLEENETYYLQYIVTTNNNMVVESPKYRLIQKTSVMPEIDASITAEMNYVNGYIDVSLIGKLNEDGLESATTGAFLITRACSDDGYKVWNEVMRFVLHGQHPSRWLWRDFTIEQGKSYKYSLQQYNDSGLYSARIISNTVEADFEDIFLYDGKYQLKIKYNPKISSFKTDLLESKLDTIGSKYPFIFRNGNVAYKEFPINGLISYQSDEENLFVSDEDLGFYADFNKLKRPGTLNRKVTSDDDDFFTALQFKTSVTSKGLYDDIKEEYKLQDEHTDIINNSKIKTTNLTHYNISAERIFKLKVLDWLNNGEPKLFRSPTEGNYIVRLMNVSLSPEEKLGRMLHSFSATAYEIADCNYNNLNNYGIITIDHPINKQLRWISLPLSTTENPNDDRYVKFNDIYYLRGEILYGYHAAATSVQFSDMLPGSTFYINVPEVLQNTDNTLLNAYSYVIGATGAYMLDAADNITSIMLPINAHYNGIVTYSFYNDAQNIFNEIESVEIIDVPCRQFIGAQTNIIDQLENVKSNFITFYYLHFALRYCATAYWNADNGVLYRDSKLLNPITELPLEPGRDLPYGRTEGSGYYEDPLMLYKYKRDSIQAGSANIIGLKYYDDIVPTEAQYYKPGKTYYQKTSGGFAEAENVNESNYASYYWIEDWIEDLFKNGQLYKEHGLYGALAKYDPSVTKYYIREPFTVYYDPYDEDSLIMSESDVERFKAELAFYQRSYRKLKIYDTNIYINGNNLNLETVESYDIDIPIIFDSVSQGCGVVLEAGYEIQEIVYSIEHTDINVIPLKERYLQYKNILTHEAMEFAVNNNDEEGYIQDLANARKNIDNAYQKFIAALAIAKDEWEANNTFDE